jgi:hypothetical protein
MWLRRTAGTSGYATTGYGVTGAAALGRCGSVTGTSCTHSIAPAKAIAAILCYAGSVDDGVKTVKPLKDVTPAAAHLVGPYSVHGGS